MPTILKTSWTILCLALLTTALPSSAAPGPAWADSKLPVRQGLEFWADASSQPDDERRPHRSLSDDLDDKLQAEIEAALGDMSLEDMLDIAEPRKAPGAKPTQTMKTGVIVKIYEPSGT